MRHIRFFRINHTIISIITVTKMVTEDNWVDTIPIASRMLSGEITKGVPISTFVELPVPSRVVSKKVERCIVRVTLDMLCMR